MANKVLGLVLKLEKSFPNSTMQDHSKIAIMAGLKDAYRAGQKDTKRDTDTFIQLRELVDIVWRECTESDEVPSTEWADRLIDRWLNPPTDG